MMMEGNSTAPPAPPPPPALHLVPPALVQRQQRRPRQWRLPRRCPQLQSPKSQFIARWLIFVFGTASTACSMAAMSRCRFLLVGPDMERNDITSSSSSSSTTTLPPSTTAGSRGWFTDVEEYYWPVTALSSNPRPSGQLSGAGWFTTSSYGSSTGAGEFLGCVHYDLTYNTFSSVHRIARALAILHGIVSCMNLVADWLMMLVVETFSTAELCLFFVKLGYPSTAMLLVSTFVILYDPYCHEPGQHCELGPTAHLVMADLILLMICSILSVMVSPPPHPVFMMWPTTLDLLVNIPTATRRTRESSGSSRSGSSITITSVVSIHVVALDHGSSTTTTTTTVPAAAAATASTVLQNIETQLDDADCEERGPRTAVVSVPEHGDSNHTTAFSSTSATRILVRERINVIEVSGDEGGRRSHDGGYLQQANRTSSRAAAEDHIEMEGLRPHHNNRRQQEEVCSTAKRSG